MKKRRVLVVCSGSSARSQMAEALIRLEAGVRGFFGWDAPCSGATGGGRRDAGTRHRHLRAAIKAADGFEGQKIDFVITLCGRAREEWPIICRRPVAVLHLPGPEVRQARLRNPF